MSVALKGMTWNHPRGYDPLVVCSALWRERTGVGIVWDRRSLQDFESFPVEQLARAYDLIVIDHPHVGQITAENCLAPLDVPGRDSERHALAAGSLGASYASYTWRDRQWALPIDAATQVQAWSPDRIGGPLETWAEVETQAAAGRAALPLRSPHALMCLYTLTANLGRPCRVDGGGPLIDAETGGKAYGLLKNLAERLDPDDFDRDPIAVFERMAMTGSPISVAPLIYGYVSYARPNFRDRRIAFADIPAAGSAGPVGSALGGTGIAVSVRSAHVEAAMDFAYWVTAAETQRGPYAMAGGQPGHAAAWDDAGVNAPVDGFYIGTRATLDGAWVRPRHDGSMPFQQAASERLRAGLMARDAAGPVLADINRLFEQSF